MEIYKLQAHPLILCFTHAVETIKSKKKLHMYCYLCFDMKVAHLKVKQDGAGTSSVSFNTAKYNIYMK